MEKKMYSFRLNKDLMNNAKRVAKGMDISLSFFISYLIREKINSLDFKQNSNIHILDINKVEILSEIASEIKKLRLELKRLVENKN